MIDFDSVYAEAYQSGTGEEFSSPATQRIFDLYKNMFSSSDVSDRRVPMVRNGQPTPSFGNYYITAPGGANTEINRERSLRVCFLGRSLIDLAAKNVAHLVPDITDTTPSRTIGMYYDSLSSAAWYDAHPSISWDEDRGDEPDAASPTRLEEWPNGEYINCLGIAIAACGAAERLGVPYLFGNEIRQADDVIGDLHRDFLCKLERTVPDIYSRMLETWVLGAVAGTTYDGTETDDKGSTFIRHTTLALDKNLTSHSESDIRAWHHFMAFRNPEIGLDEPGVNQSLDSWIQFDPYAVTLSRIVPSEDIAYRYFLSTLANSPGDIMLHVEPRDFIDGTYRSLHIALNVYKQWAASLECAKDIQLKHPKDYERLARSICQVEHDMLMAYMSRSDDEGVGDLPYTPSRLFQRTLMFAWYLYAHPDFQESTAVISETNRNSDKEPIEISEEAAGQFMYGDSSLQKREFMLEAARLIPLVGFLSIYGGVLEKMMKIKTNGIANVVSELARPDFMAGAMYLNHYATHRKGGRINIARELAKLTSSQLIWHDARQDPGANTDDAVAQTTSLVQEMSRKLLHTRVQIHRPRSTNRER